MHLPNQQVRVKKRRNGERTDTQADTRQADRQTDGRTDRQTDRQADRQTETQTATDQRSEDPRKRALLPTTHLNQLPQPRTNPTSQPPQPTLAANYLNQLPQPTPNTRQVSKHTTQHNVRFNSMSIYALSSSSFVVRRLSFGQKTQNTEPNEVQPITVQCFIYSFRGRVDS